MPIKKVPVEYSHPKKTKPKTAASENKTVPFTEQIIGPSQRVKSGRPTDASDTELLRLVAAVPVTGTHPLFDQMIDSGLGARQSVLGLLKRGFDEFEKSLLNGDNTEVVETVSENGEMVETTRSVSAGVILAARKRFDPFGVMSKRALGLKIGTAIIHQTK